MGNLVIFKNTFYQAFSRVVTSGIGFIITVIIARHFGAQGYGDFTKITAFIGLFYLFLDFGLNAIFLQEDKKETHFRDLFYVRLLIAVFLALFINAVSFFLLPFNKELNLGFSESVKIGIAIFSLSIFAQAVLLSSNVIFQKKLRYDLFLIASVIGSIVALILTATFVLFSFPLALVLIAFVLGSFTAAFFSILWTKEKLIPPSFNPAFIKRLFSSSFPLGLMLVFNFVYFRADIFLLSLFKPTFDVGVYGLSYKVFDFLIALPLFLSNSIYPTLLKWQKNYRKFTDFARFYFFVFLLLSLVILILFWFFAPLISLVNKEFVYSVLPLRILILSLPFFFTTSILQWILISQKKQKFLMFVYFGSTAVNIWLNLIFIPRSSYIASAIITGVSEALVFVILFYKVLAMQKNMQKEVQV